MTFLENIPFYIILNICFFLFTVGLWGLFGVRRNLLLLLMSLEIVLFAINLIFVVFSFYMDDSTGQIFALVVLTVAAAESAIGLALLVIYYRLRGIIDLDLLNNLKS